MNLAIPSLHFSPKCIFFLFHQLPLLKPPSSGSSSLSSVPQDTFQWLRNRQCLKHPCDSSFLMEERGRRSPLLYCAFLLVLADLVIWLTRFSIKKYYPLLFLVSVQLKLLTSLRQEDHPLPGWGGENQKCAWQPPSCVFSPHARGRPWGWQPPPMLCLQ